MSSLHSCHHLVHSLFFRNTPPPPHISTLPLHDALPIFDHQVGVPPPLGVGHLRVEPPLDLLAGQAAGRHDARDGVLALRDRKSTRLNSSHMSISYAVFCLKKKKTTNIRVVVEVRGIGTI